LRDRRRRWNIILIVFVLFFQPFEPMLDPMGRPTHVDLGVVENVTFEGLLLAVLLFLGFPALLIVWALYP
jgi:hypothetical protein